MRHRLAASLLAILVLALAAFAGTSLAGNGHGNGGGGGDHGQSQQQQPQQQAQPSHGHGSWSKQSSTSPSSPATGGDNSQGVKPSSSTKHDTYATASSNQTKQYGNGKTAGQIATQAGYGNATLHGPGNSQPHKTACAGHEVDVHALKSHGSKCGAGAQQGVQQVEQKQKVEKQKVEKQKLEEQKPAPAPAPVVVQAPQSNGVSASAHAHVVICHATGSSTNPYVRISPSAAGVFHGHLGHQDGRDIVPPFVWNGQTYSENWDANGQAIWNAGCAVPAAAATQAPAAPSTPAPAPAATPAPSATQAQAAAVTTTPAPAPAVVPSATVTPTNAPAIGAVKGATVTLTPKTTRTAAAPARAKPRGGVLGATTRLGSSVSGTRLPFTGLPLWIFAAVAAGLILVGAGVRRSARNRA
jgi:hypothetical protein